MADKTYKWADNADGKYYVDESCIAAKFCVASAPENFKMTDAGYALVYMQPGNPQEEGKVREAMAGCPVNAIGDDD